MSNKYHEALADPLKLSKLQRRPVRRVSSAGSIRQGAIESPTTTTSAFSCSSRAISAGRETAWIDEAIRPEARAMSWTGTPAIDVAAGVVAQLAADAVTVDWVPGCTREDPALFSHRREGRTGRSAGVIVRRSA